MSIHEIKGRDKLEEMAQALKEAATTMGALEHVIVIGILADETVVTLAHSGVSVLEAVGALAVATIEHAEDLILPDGDDDE